MKKALHISLGQTLFALEDDAYEKLNHYLEGIRTHFANTVGADEILADIESRIAEQFLETKKAILGIIDVDAVIASMGAVSDFGEESAKEKSSSGHEHSSKSHFKKLYRHPDDVLLGGVASGLASYLNLPTLWVRIAFIVFIVTTGFGILIYIMLWIIVPKARTPSQKLEMAGNKITLETISESVKKKIEEVKKTIGE